MRKVEVAANIKTSPERALEAFLDPAMLADWWGVERCLIEPRDGGLYSLAWNVTEAGFGFVSTGLIKRFQPGRLLEIEKVVYMNPERPLLGPLGLTVQAAKEAGAMTRVTLCQSGYQEGADWDWYHQVVAQAWPAVMETIKSYLEGTFQLPLTLSRLSEQLLAWPGTSVSVQWGTDRVFKVAGKMFACTDPTLKGVSFKADPDALVDWMATPGVRPAPYLARAGWVLLEAPASFERERLQGGLRRSYELVRDSLPRKLRLSL